MQKVEELSSPQKIKSFYMTKEQIAMLEKIPPGYRSYVMGKLVLRWPELISEDFDGKPHIAEIQIRSMDDKKFLAFFNSDEPFTISFEAIIRDIRESSLVETISKINDLISKKNLIIDKVELCDALIKIFSEHLKEMKE